MARPIRFGKYGMLEDPSDRHIAWMADGKHYLAICKGYYLKSLPGGGKGVFLKTRWLNGEPGLEVSARDVKVLEED
jgi:hypothetical protein